MILPADSYIVINKGNILEIDKKILIDLYQPIIGSKAVSRCQKADRTGKRTVTEANKGIRSSC